MRILESSFRHARPHASDPGAATAAHLGVTRTLVSGRSPGIAVTVSVSHGIDGIDQKTDPGPPVNKNIYQMSHRERRHLRIDDLPASLSDALDELEKDELIRDTLGEHIFQHFVEAKRKEWDDYTRHVSSWETERYLRVY